MKRVVVIGLGIFGFNIVKDLYEKGHDVIAIDKNKEIVQKIKDFSTKAILADGTDKDVMESIGIQEDDVVIVSFGEDRLGGEILDLLDHILVFVNGNNLMPFFVEVFDNIETENSQSNNDDSPHLKSSCTYLSFFNGDLSASRSPSLALH